LVVEHDPNTITILAIPDINWYQNFSPYTEPFEDTHVIAHFAANFIIYEDPTIPPELNKQPRIEPLAIYIFCTHHQNNNVGPSDDLYTLTTILQNMQNLQYHIQIVAPTPNNVTVNKNPN